MRTKIQNQKSDTKLHGIMIPDFKPGFSPFVKIEFVALSLVNSFTSLKLTSILSKTQKKI